MSRAKFLKLLVWINGAVPGVLLTYDACRGKLGANVVSESLHTTGLLALVFLTLALAVTPLKMITQRNELIAVRRPLGLWAFYYACCHLLIYVGFDRQFDLSSTVHELATRRFLQVGLLAFSVLVPLAITSSDSMVRKLGSKRWKRLHRLAYFATTIAVLHYYMQVKSDVRQPVVFAIVICALLVVRIAGRSGNKKKPLKQGGHEKQLSSATR